MDPEGVVSQSDPNVLREYLYVNQHNIDPLAPYLPQETIDFLANNTAWTPSNQTYTAPGYQTGGPGSAVGGHSGNPNAFNFGSPAAVGTWASDPANAHNLAQAMTRANRNVFVGQWYNSETGWNPNTPWSAEALQGVEVNGNPLFIGDAGGSTGFSEPEVFNPSQDIPVQDILQPLTSNWPLASEMAGGSLEGLQDTEFAIDPVHNELYVNGQRWDEGHPLLGQMEASITGSGAGLQVNVAAPGDGAPTGAAGDSLAVSDADLAAGSIVGGDVPDAPTWAGSVTEENLVGSTEDLQNPEDIEAEQGQYSPESLAQIQQTWGQEIRGAVEQSLPPLPELPFSQTAKAVNLD